MVTAESRRLVWRKSTYSASNGDCVELAWRKSSFSAANGDCVEVAWPVDAVAVRDSKQTASPVLDFPVDNWRRFLAER